MSRFRYLREGGPYRSRGGIVLGVCRGLADHFDFKVFWIRVLLVVMTIASGIWPVVFVYIIASLIMRPEPVRPIASEAEQEFYDSYVDSRQTAARRMKRRAERLERRIRRMEDAVTSPEFQWDRKWRS